jgi:hypothetical protein
LQPGPARRPRVPSLAPLLLTGLVAVAVLGLTYWRLWYGVDFTDESFYVAVPYRLVQGARPFVDETAVAQQLVGILVYPFLRGYTALAGRTGIVLFLRHLQFLFSVGVAAAVAASLRPVLATRHAVLVGLAAVAFVPFGIHGLSYDTLGGGLFTAGCFLGFACLREPERRWFRLLGGLCHGLAVFAYPPLLLAVAACYLVRLVLAHGPARRATLAFDLPALVLPLAGLGLLVLAVGPHRVLADYRASRTGAVKHADLHKLAGLADHEWHTFRTWYLVLAALAAIALTWRRRRWIARVALLALPLLVLPPALHSYTASLEYVAHLGWLALPLFILVRARPGAAELLAACWLPALVAGITTGYTSSNGGVNIAIGAFPAALVAVVFLIWALGEPPELAAVPAVLTLALLLWFQVPVYRDGPISALSARIAHGPYAGLLTTPAKRAFLDRLGRDLAGVRAPCRILFFDDFPAGYLLTGARPDTTQAWLSSRAPARDEQTLLAYYRTHGLPDLVVVMSRIPYAAPAGRGERYRAGDPLLVLVHAPPYRLAASRLEYRIYRRATGCATGRT